MYSHSTEVNWRLIRWNNSGKDCESNERRGLGGECWSEVWYAAVW